MNNLTAHTCRCLLLTGLLVAGLASQAMAQSQKGTVSGTITDPSGAVLKGAQILIEPQSVSAATNEEGVYVVNGLPAGKYTVTISYVGFTTLSKTVDIVGGQTAVADAKLEVQLQSQSVLVTAPRVSAEAERLTSNERQTT
jgi:carboxypeptidase family protein